VFLKADFRNNARFCSAITGLSSSSFTRGGRINKNARKTIEVGGGGPSENKGKVERGWN
jgi:hypothetical protein